jgi:Flp pilus assembly protein TadD
MKNEPARSVELLTKVLALQEMKNPRAFYFRGLAYRKLGERDKAEHDLEQAAQLGESDAADALQRRQRPGR